MTETKRVRVASHPPSATNIGTCNVAELHLFMATFMDTDARKSMAESSKGWKVVIESPQSRAPGGFYSMWRTTPAKALRGATKVELPDEPGPGGIQYKLLAQYTRPLEAVRVMQPLNGRQLERLKMTIPSMALGQPVFYLHILHITPSWLAYYRNIASFKFTRDDDPRRPCRCGCRGVCPGPMCPITVSLGARSWDCSQKRRCPGHKRKGLFRCFDGFECPAHPCCCRMT
jgi:hypothetical protein